MINTKSVNGTQHYLQIESHNGQLSPFSGCYGPKHLIFFLKETDCHKTHNSTVIVIFLKWVWLHFSNPLQQLKPPEDILKMVETVNLRF